jgi:hypothetical protein
MERDKMDPSGAAFGALQKVGFLARASTVALLFILLHASRRNWWAPVPTCQCHDSQTTSQGDQLFPFFLLVVSEIYSCGSTATTNRNILPVQLQWCIDSHSWDWEEQVQVTTLFVFSFYDEKMKMHWLIVMMKRFTSNKSR